MSRLSLAKSYQLASGPAVEPFEAYAARLELDFATLLNSDPSEPTIHRFLEHHPSLVPGMRSLGVLPSAFPFQSILISEPVLPAVGKRHPDFDGGSPIRVSAFTQPSSRSSDQASDYSPAGAYRRRSLPKRAINSPSGEHGSAGRMRLRPFASNTARERLGSTMHSNRASFWSTDADLSARTILSFHASARAFLIALQSTSPRTIGCAQTPYSPM